MINMESEKLQEILGLCLEIQNGRKHIAEFKTSNRGIGCEVWIKEGGTRKEGFMKDFCFYDVEACKEENENEYQNCVKYLKELLQEEKER